MKTCTKCLVEKDESLFHKSKLYKDGLYGKCAVCVNQTNRERYTRDKEHISKQHRQYRAIHKDTVLKSKKKYRESHKEQARKADKSYRERNPHKIREKNRRRRARIRQNGCIPYKDTDVYARDRGMCQICGAGPLEKYDIDHIIPINVGGPDSMMNVRVTCPSCNQRRPKDGSDIPIVKRKRINTKKIVTDQVEMDFAA